MSGDALPILEHLVIALVAGGLIGAERTYHGRPAGFRTHTLVCLASSALMLVTMYQARWFPQPYSDAVRMDPTRMAQGIMTGIGFLGAGVIFKEGLTVRGLTTAASIWITAAIGILAGIGFYLPLVITAVLTLGTLSVFRFMEARMPVQFYARLEIEFQREATMPEGEFRRFLAGHGFSIANLSYRYSADAGRFDYGMVIRSDDATKVRVLAVALRKLPSVRAFTMSPMGD